MVQARCGPSSWSWDSWELGRVRHRTRVPEGALEHPVQHCTHTLACSMMICAMFRRRRSATTSLRQRQRQPAPSRPDHLQDPSTRSNSMHVRRHYIAGSWSTFRQALSSLEVGDPVPVRVCVCVRVCECECVSSPARGSFINTDPDPGPGPGPAHSTAVSREFSWPLIIRVDEALVGERSQQP